MKEIEEINRSIIESKQIGNGGYTRAQLEEWGVPWPAKKGWKKELIKGKLLVEEPLPLLVELRI